MSAIGKKNAAGKQEASSANDIFFFAATEEIAELTNILDIYPRRIHERDPYNATLLHAAAMNGRMNTLKLLIARGGDMFARDKSGNTALHYAALREQGDIMRFLLSKKDENRREVKEILEWKNQLGMTILHDVCYIESKDMAMMLLEYGANINIKDNAGRTCLDLLGTKPRTTMNADGKARWRQEIQNEYQRWQVLLKARSQNAKKY